MNNLTPAPASLRPTPGRLLPCNATEAASTIRKDRGCRVLMPIHDGSGKVLRYETLAYAIGRTSEIARYRAAYISKAVNEKQERDGGTINGGGR